MQFPKIVQTRTQLYFCAEEGKLPVQNILNGNIDGNKELNYHIDERNPRLKVEIICGEGQQKSKRGIWFRKNAVAKMFQAVDRIQDDLNSYL